MRYSITVFQLGEKDGRPHRTDIAHFTTAQTAPEMEDTVTRLHRQFPAPDFDVDVQATPRSTS